jgi:vacuolar-type H+-ATPase subunit E/Vma4
VLKGEAEGLAALARIVVEDAEAACRREEDLALNESRRLVLEAEDRLAELRRAAHALGRTRGEAAEAAEAASADREVAAVHGAAFDALLERFLQRVAMRLRALPESEGYAGSLEHWARRAAAAIDGPVEVFCGRRDRPAVYEALLAAGAEDFHVRVDHGIGVGFVVRDLEGRTVSDLRPDALLAEHRDALRAILERHVPPFSPRAGEAEPAPTA